MSSAVGSTGGGAAVEPDPVRRGGTVVLVRPDDVDPVVRLGRFAGIEWAPELPFTPWSLAGAGLGVHLEVRATAQAEAVLVAAARGASVVAAPAPGWTEQVRLRHAIRRVARLVRWDAEPPAALGLHPDEVRLLLALATGASVASAATEVGCSLRTAHRQLARARRHLDVPSNAAAASALVVVVSTLGPTRPAATTRRSSR